MSARKGATKPRFKTECSTSDQWYGYMSDSTRSVFLCFSFNTRWMGAWFSTRQIQSDRTSPLRLVSFGHFRIYQDNISFLLSSFLSSSLFYRSFHFTSITLFFCLFLFVSSTFSPPPYKLYSFVFSIYSFIFFYSFFFCHFEIFWLCSTSLNYFILWVNSWLYQRLSCTSSMNKL
jgi:hypothetical protein